MDPAWVSHRLCETALKYNNIELYANPTTDIHLLDTF